MAEGEREPDYRMSLAAERTYLAYVRTALGLMAAGIALTVGFPHAGATEIRRAFGILLVLMGVGVLLLARGRWIAIDRAMRRGQPLPHFGVPLMLSWILAIIGVVAIGLIVLS